MECLRLVPTTYSNVHVVFFCIFSSSFHLIAVLIGKGVTDLLRHRKMAFSVPVETISPGVEILHLYNI